MNYTFRIVWNIFTSSIKGCFCLFVFFSHSCQQVPAFSSNTVTLLGEEKGQKVDGAPFQHDCSWIGIHQPADFLKTVHALEWAAEWEDSGGVHLQRNALLARLSGERLNASHHLEPLGTRGQPACLERMSAKEQVTALVDDQVYSALSPTVKNSSPGPACRRLRERADLPHPGAPPKSQTARARLVLCFFTSSSQIPTQDTTDSILDPSEEPRPSPSKRTLFISVQSMHSHAPLFHTIFFINSVIMLSPPTPSP